MTDRTAAANELIQTETGFFKSMISGPIALFYDKPMDPNLARGAAITVGIASAVATGIYTRKRAIEGKPPMLGFLF